VIIRFIRRCASGFLAAGMAKSACDAADLRRAIEAYEFFYGTVATEAVMLQGQAAARKVNEVGIVMAASPRQQLSAVGFLYTTLLCFF
jgi:hypothetical protein